MYKAIVIGGGPGGYVSAIRLSQLGFKTALIEKKYLGGTCTNKGCIPTKALLTAAHLYNDILKKSRKFGIHIGNIKYDFSDILKHMNKSITLSRKGIEYLLKKNNIDFFNDIGIIEDKNHIKLKKENRVLETKNIILAQGSQPSIFSPFDSVKGLWTSDSVFEMTEIPESILIIGGGVIGVEFSTLFSFLGKKVYLVELFEHILPSEDKDAVEIIRKSLIKNNVSIYEKSSVQNILVKNNKYVSIVKTNGREIEIESEKVLLAVGRRANITNDIRNLNIAFSKKGVIVNNKMETSEKNIYAIGDITGEHMLAHVAMKEGIVAAENIAGKDSKMSYSAVPSIIFSSPEIASTGIKEKDINENMKIFKFPLSANARANTLGERNGFVKIIKNIRTNEIKGMTIVSPSATEIISQGSIAIQLKIKNEDLLKCIFPHPTLSEGVGETLEGLEDKSIHI